LLGKSLNLFMLFSSSKIKDCKITKTFHHIGFIWG